MKTEQPPTVTDLQDKKKKKTWIPAVLTVLVLLITGAGGVYWTTMRPAKTEQEPDSTKAAKEEPQGMRLSSTAKLGALQMDEATEEEAPLSLGNTDQAQPLGRTRNAVPKGFGLESSEDQKETAEAEPAPATNPRSEPAPTIAEPAPTTGEELTEVPEGGINLQPPAETKVSPSPKTDNTENIVEKIDPRNVGVTTNDGPEKEYEETALTVQRTLTAVMGEDKQMIRLKVPVMYKSRTLRLEGDSLTEAKRIHHELKEKAAALAGLKTDLEKLLGDWNALVRKTTPSEALLPESPTLPENQSAGALNRNGNPDLEPGKAISYEILNP